LESAQALVQRPVVDKRLRRPNRGWQEDDKSDPVQSGGATETGWAVLVC